MPKTHNGFVATQQNTSQ